MSYKSILVHVDHSPHGEARVRAAAELALAQHAHLTGAAMTGLSSTIYENSGADLGMALIAEQMAVLRERARGALARFEAIASAIGVLSIESRLIEDEPEAALVLQARYADLVVVSQVDLEDSCARLAPGLPAYVMLAGARPVLVVPHHGAATPPAARVVLAWDGSREAARAVSGALPLLQAASAVTVAVFNPGPAHGAEPGADMALYLARHGARVEAGVHHTSGDVGQALLSLVADQQAGLLVMGGYGHTRLRETLLGGVTRTILQSMTVPVLLAH